MQKQCRPKIRTRGIHRNWAGETKNAASVSLRGGAEGRGRENVIGKHLAGRRGRVRRCRRRSRRWVPPRRCAAWPPAWRATWWRRTGCAHGRRSPRPSGAPYRPRRRRAPRAGRAPTGRRTDRRAPRGARAPRTPTTTPAAGAGAACPPARSAFLSRVEGLGQDGAPGRERALAVSRQGGQGASRAWLAREASALLSWGADASGAASITCVARRRRRREGKGRARGRGFWQILKFGSGGALPWVKWGLD